MAPICGWAGKNMPDIEDDDEYEPVDVDQPVPDDETERRRLREAAEAAEVQREVLLARIARARSLIYEAQARGDSAEEAALRKKVADLTAERDGL
jgi:hypothetical protein